MLPTVQGVAVDTKVRSAPKKVPAVRSSVSLKILMAATGLLLAGFLFAHMAGNLKIFVGAESFDHYAHWLRQIGAPILPDTWYLWLQRTVLTAALIGHIAAATILTRQARKARP